MILIQPSLKRNNLNTALHVPQFSKNFDFNFKTNIQMYLISVDMILYLIWYFRL